MQMDNQFLSFYPRCLVSQAAIMFLAVKLLLSKLFIVKKLLNSRVQTSSVVEWFKADANCFSIWSINSL